MATDKELKLEGSSKRKGALSLKTKLQEERFETLIGEVEDYAIILLDTSGTVITWNRGAEKIKGYLPDEIIGRSYKVFYSKEDRETGQPEELLGTANETGKATHEGWSIRKDGTRFWGSIVITAIHGATGDVTGYLKVTRDLSERKIAEDKYSNYVEELKIKNLQLKQSEERYHKMVTEVTDYVIILLDINGNVLDWNKGAEKIKGYKRDEIIGKSFRLFYTKEDKDSDLPGSLLKLAVEKGSVNHDGWRIRKDGTRFWGSVVITALHRDDGDIFGFSKVTRDLTEKKVAEDKLNNLADELKFRNEELIQSEERYHKMISEVTDYAIILLDPTGIIMNWNAGAEAIKGYKQHEIVGKSFQQFYQESDRESGFPLKLLAQAADKGKVVHEGWRVRKDGSKFWGSVVITALHDKTNAIIGFSKVTRDLTEKKLADDQLLSKSIELESKNKSLQRLNEEVTSFAYVASHDLKEPLRKIRTFASRLRETNDPINTEELVDKIQNSAIRMQNLMDDLLVYSQLTTDQNTFIKLDLNKILLDVLNDLEVPISEKAATFEIQQLPEVNGILFQIHQVFFNLISNAVKFSKPYESPNIKISGNVAHGKEIPLGLVNDLKEYVKITVTDNGIGFDVANSKKIFDVFQRLHPRTEYSGTGIGLAIVKRVMENHHGIIIANSAPLEGATFELYFPKNNNN
jgi:PAS domain S-box-containing protein